MTEMTSHKRSTAALLAACALGASGCAGGDSTPATSAPSTSAPSTSAISDASRCGPESLKGTYLYEIHGDQQFAEGFLPFLEVGLMVFDGQGSVKRIGTDSNRLEETSTSMTYTVGEDCIGELTTTTGGAYRATVSPSGGEVSFFAAGTGAQPALDGAAERVSAETSITCDTGTLTGTYQYRSRGSFGDGVHVEHGFEVYDGQGGATNAFRVAGVDTTERLVGTYEVDAGCHAVVTYDNGVTLDQYLAPDGGQFYWIQTDGFEEPGLFGGHEHRVSSSVETLITTGS